MREEDVEWVVNDLGELGVRINGRHFFLYKGRSLEYGEKTGNVVLHDDGTPMRVRLVGKREFGETCWPLKWVQQGHCERRYTVNTVHHPGLSDEPREKFEWYDLPAGDDSKLSE